MMKRDVSIKYRIEFYNIANQLILNFMKIQMKLSYLFTLIAIFFLTIQNLSSQCSNNATITITEPDQLDLVTEGASHSIQWEGSLQGNNCPVKILYRIDGGGWIFIATSTPDDGGYLWSAPSGVNSTNVDLRIEYLVVDSLGNTIGDIKNISVQEENQTINISSPNGGVFYSGCDMSISFTTPPPANNVRIELVQSNNNTVRGDLSFLQPNNSTYVWTVGTDATGTYIPNLPNIGYKIKVFELGANAGIAYSPSFSMPSPSISLLVPNGGEGYVLGDVVPVTWNHVNFCGNVSIDLQDASHGFIKTIAEDIPNTGTYDWEASGVPPGEYRMKVHRTVDPAFTITADSSFRSFTIESNGGGCIEGLIIIGNVLSHIYKSEGQLISYNANIASTEMVELISDTAILLDHDFNVELGAELDALIESCSGN